jgi:hypothetical protein
VIKVDTLIEPTQSEINALFDTLLTRIMRDIIRRGREKVHLKSVLIFDIFFHTHLYFLNRRKVEAELKVRIR